MTSRFLCRVQRYQKCEAGFISRGYNHRDLWANMQTEVIIQFLLPSRSQKKEKISAERKQTSEARRKSAEISFLNLKLYVTKKLSY